MRVMNILHDSNVDGEGLRSVLFVAGCPHHCPGCHNPESWDFGAGAEMSVEEVAEYLLCNELTDITLSGGEPFAQADELAQLVDMAHELGKDVWCYTGYTYEYLRDHGTDSQKALLSKVDTLVDGPFIERLRDPYALFRGSSNQRIIHLGGVEK